MAPTTARIKRMLRSHRTNPTSAPTTLMTIQAPTMMMTPARTMCQKSNFKLYLRGRGWLDIIVRLSLLTFPEAV